MAENETVYVTIILHLRIHAYKVFTFHPFRNCLLFEFNPFQEFIFESIFSLDIGIFDIKVMIQVILFVPFHEKEFKDSQNCFKLTTKHLHNQVF